MLHSNEIVRNAALRVKCNGHVLELRDKYTWAFHGHVFFCILFAMLKGQVAMLKGQVAMLKGQVAMLKGQVAVLKGQVAMLKGQVAMLKGQVAMLKGQVAMLKGQVAMLKGQVSCHGEVSGLQELHPTPQLLHAFQNVTSALTFLR